MMRACAFLVAFSLGCTQPETPTQSLAPTPSTLPKAQPAPSSINAVIPAPVIEVENVSTAAPGPVYVLVDHSGVLQITDGGVTTVFPVPTDRSSHFTEIAVSPAGTLWLSDFQGIRIRSLLGETSTIRNVKDGPLYEKLIVRSDKDVWAVSSDIEWNVLHYEGSAWKALRQRKQFSGKYDDNKFSGLAVTTEGTWVASWNGLWRGVGDQWEKIALPEGLSTGPDLLVYRDQLIVVGPGAAFLRQSGAWKKLVWPERILLRWAVSDLGLVAAPIQDKPRIVIGPIDGAGKFIESDVILGHDIRTLTFDGAGRVWVGTNQALAVVDRKGHLLGQWSAGTLDGLTGGILDIAVVGAGPATLPKPKIGRTWEITGKFVTYKTRTALVGASLAMCSSGSFACANDPHAKRFTTDAQGGFRFSAVPEGEYWIEMQPPQGLTDCVTPFTLTNTWVAPAQHCREKPEAPGVCDLGTIQTCLPFEMPPPHH
jgi:hypothetical protein